MYCLIGALVIISITALNVYVHLLMPRDGGWHPDGPPDRMARWIDGAWQYREMTDAEADNEFDAWQW